MKSFSLRGTTGLTGDNCQHIEQSYGHRHTLPAVLTNLIKRGIQHAGKSKRLYYQPKPPLVIKAVFPRDLSSGQQAQGRAKLVNAVYRGVGIIIARRKRANGNFNQLMDRILWVLFWGSSVPNYISPGNLVGDVLGEFFLAVFTRLSMLIT